MPVANKGEPIEFRLFYGRYWAIFHILLGTLAQFGIGVAGQIIQSILFGLDLPAILSGIWLALSHKQEERKVRQ
jgi:hypothetical protein